MNTLISEPTETNNKHELREIMRTERLDATLVVAMLSKAMKREFSKRTVQSWMADENKTSSRPCPDWVIKNLKAEIKKRQARAG